MCDPKCSPDAVKAALKIVPPGCWYRRDSAGGVLQERSVLPGVARQTTRVPPGSPDKNSPGGKPVVVR